MEDDTSSILSFQDDLQEDALSLCDLSSNAFSEVTDDNDPYCGSFFPSPSRDAFEFSITEPSAETVSHVDTILFCGKAIPFEQPRHLHRSDSSFKRLCRRVDSGPAWLPRSGSLRSPISKAAVVAAPAAGSCRYSTSSGREYKAIIGVTKFQSRMDMGEIRKRQSRQAPAPLFPAGTDGVELDSAMATGGRRGHGHWGLLRPLRCRSHLVGALARVSIGCMRHV
ncbi:hypothetical protein CDL15_Pgr026016 [Punica granatum]|uniref:Uncharacterized protein n=1 Tax=Punica granatum TaxID=22663 RepID=A0A218WBZ8_PUNGR|nr:hypothetical protein CDL15_Pgr026016 [Punica granatum]PKI43259.1 hypothetical protein CRG98_036345 [Punica granatum]